jgi:hypothetical protein
MDLSEVRFESSEHLQTFKQINMVRHFQLPVRALLLGDVGRESGSLGSWALCRFCPRDEVRVSSLSDREFGAKVQWLYWDR